MILTKYEKIEKFILKGITNGTYKPDEKVPSENKLAESFKVSRMTARKALDSLVTKGYLYKIKCKGTYVKDRENRENIYLDEMIGFTDRVKRSGRIPKTEVKTFEIKKPSKNSANKLKISLDEDIFYIERIRYIDDEPVILEITYMPVKVSPDLTKKEIKNSKYAYLRDHDHKITEMIKEYIPVIPNPEVRKMLLLDKNMAMFKKELVSILENNSIFEYTKIYYNQNKYRFLQITKSAEID
jgi:DNA-binding GntR family transcriptional regulator